MIWNNSELSVLHTLAVPQPFLLLIAANLALTGFLGWKGSLWPVLTWLAVQRSKAVFLLALYVSINYMKIFVNICITTQPCHSHFCCWLLPIWPKLDFWAENGAYGLCQIGWRYNGAKLSFYWPCMIVSMIINTSETVSITPQPAQPFYLLIAANLALAGFLGWKWSLWSVPAWLTAQRS